MSNQASQSQFVRVFISGNVQGVGYRASTVEQARKLGVNGWVSNRADGRVEAIFEGDKAAVEQMIDWCHHGSSAARVEAVSVEEIEPQAIQGFDIKY